MISSLCTFLDTESIDARDSWLREVSVTSFSVTVTSCCGLGLKCFEDWRRIRLVVNTLLLLLLLPPPPMEPDKLVLEKPLKDDNMERFGSFLLAKNFGKKYMTIVARVSTLNIKLRSPLNVDSFTVDDSPDDIMSTINRNTTKRKWE